MITDRDLEPRWEDDIGVNYEEGEPLRAGQKEKERDRHRWELDPASAEDYAERAHPQSNSERIRRMGHVDRYGHAGR